MMMLALVLLVGVGVGAGVPPAGVLGPGGRGLTPEGVVGSCCWMVARVVSRESRLRETF